MKPNCDKLAITLLTIDLVRKLPLRYAFYRAGPDVRFE